MSEELSDVSELSFELSEDLDEISELSLELIRLDDDDLRELLELEPEPETEQAPNSPRAKSNIVIKAKSLSLNFCIFLPPFIFFSIDNNVAIMYIIYKVKGGFNIQKYFLSI